MLEIAETFDHDPAVRRMGVWPRGAQVRTMAGTRRKPDSSRKPKWAPSSAVFFYPGPHVLEPELDGGVVALPGPIVGLLATPPQAMHQLPDIDKRVADAKFLADDAPDPLQRPHVRWIPSGKRSLLQDAQELLFLPRTQQGGASRRRSRLEPFDAALAKRLVPSDDRAQRGTCPQGHSPIGVASLQEADGEKPPLLEAPRCTGGSHAPQYTIFRGRYPFNN